MKKGTLYGVVALFLVLLILVSTVALYYYEEDQLVSSQNHRYQSELNTALSHYSSLSQDFNSSLENYKLTLTLLASALSNLNTTIPAYHLGSQALASLWSSYQQLARSSGRTALVYEVQMLVDYGNGTRRWYNNTAIQPGWNGYVATLVLMNGNIQATWYPQYGEHLVTGIGGVSQGSSNSWFFWEYGSGGWSVASTGADGAQINNGTRIAWTLCGYDSNFNPSCTP